MRGLVIALLVVLALWLLLAVVLVLIGRRLAARQLFTMVPNLLRLARDLVRDPRVPRSSKVLLGAAAVWIASPIDLLPEFIPFLGPLDDVVIAVLVLRHVVRRAGADVIREHWRGDPATIVMILRMSGAG
jgi:uncharacterized membrane protein YkvA (DUF1232 family)